MYNSVSGKLTKKGDQQIYIENNGLEYLISVSEFCLKELPEAGADCRVLVYLHHREDQFSLFGFYSEEERALFFELIKVGGIGPKQALKILSGMSAEVFIKALEKEDLEALTRIQGLGRKTAQKIILALRGKLTEAGPALSPLNNELVQALVDMGFDKKRSVQIVSQILSEAGDNTIGENEIIKQAIVRLSS